MMYKSRDVSIVGTNGYKIPARLYSLRLPWRRRNRVTRFALIRTTETTDG